jgi:hypothetical protein
MPPRPVLPLLTVLAVAASGCGSTGGAAPATSCAGPGTICTVIGTGQQGYNGDGHPPDQTELNLPSVARLGPDGLLYVMDFNNMRLRCRMADHTVDSVVGNGVHAFALFGADARSTPLENPVDFGFSPDGHLLIVALHDPRVLRIEQDGTVGWIAGTGDYGDSGDGGQARFAQFQELASIAVAPDGSLFLSDDKAHRVRVIRPDGTVQAYAGNGTEGYAGDGGPATAAQLDHPGQIALDGSGNLYVADTYNHRVRRVDAATGVITTVAGTGTQGLSGDGGLATQAELALPKGVIVGPGGELYVSDTGNHRVRRVGLDGVIATVVGTGEGYAGDGGQASDAKLKGPAYLTATSDSLYVADQENQVVRQVPLPLP